MPSQIRELRIVLPLDAKDVRRGNIYSRARFRQANATKTHHRLVDTCQYRSEQSSEGIGVYTQHAYSAGHFVPGWAWKVMETLTGRSLGREGLKVVTETWEEHPRCRTLYHFPQLGTRLQLSVTSIVVEGDRGHKPNALGLTERELRSRRVEILDIRSHKLCGLSASAVPPHEDPSRVRFADGTSALLPGWQSSCKPVTCVYYAIRLKVDVWALVRPRAENLLLKELREAYLKLARLTFCWKDSWMPMTLQQAMQDAGIDVDSKADSAPPPIALPTDQRPRQSKLSRWAGGLLGRRSRL